MDMKSLKDYERTIKFYSLLIMFYKANKIMIIEALSMKSQNLLVFEI